MSLVNPLQMPPIYTSDVAVSSSDRRSSSRHGEGPGLSCLLVSRQSVLNMTRQDYWLLERGLSMALDGNICPMTNSLWSIQIQYIIK